MKNFATKFSLLMMLICKHRVQIFQAVGHKTHCTISLTLLRFIKAFTKVSNKTNLLFKNQPWKVIGFSTDEFFIALLSIFPHISGPGTASLRAMGFKTMPFPQDQQPEQSTVLGAPAIS